MSTTAPTPAEVFPPRRVRDRHHPVQRVACPQPLDISHPRGLSREEAVSAYKVCDVVLGRLAVVRPADVLVELFPAFAIAVDAEFMHAGSDLTDRWVAGEVLAFILLARGEEASGWRLARAEDGHRPTRTAPALREGGAPWITSADLPARDVQRAPASTPTPQVRQTISLTSRLGSALRDADKARAQLRALRTQNHAALEALATLDDDHHRFADPEEQLRFEVQLAYARRTTPAEKADLPMRPWTLGPDFLSSLSNVGGIPRQKVVDVIVDIVTGRACASAGRGLHRFRSGDGAASAIRSRADGATCWRIALQKNSPAARRLHYWVAPGGQVELADVRLHDDTRP